MITPVLFCGGSGTRLWPLSRKGFPKQFIWLVGKESLFTASAARLLGPNFVAPVIVKGSDFRFIVTEQLLADGVDSGTILVAPEVRLRAESSGYEISDPAAFRAEVQSGWQPQGRGRS